MKRLEGKTAIVTGAAQGIGLAIAQRFTAEGARVLLADRSAERVNAAAAALEQPAMQVDVSARPEVLAMVATALDRFGGVDILVNNAGVFESAPLLDLREADFDRVMSINLKSVLYSLQAVAPHMIARRSGAIVNVASIAGVLGSSGALAYCVSKAAVIQMTNVAALELAPHGVRVNAIGPGTIATEMSTITYADPEKNRQWRSRTPMKRAGEPEEIAGVALFLASEDASYVTGKTIFTDGGRLGLNLTV